MTVNIAHYDESSEIVLDSEKVAAESGGALSFAHAYRNGGCVIVHLEGTYTGQTQGTPFVAAKLPADYAPGATVTPLAFGALTAASITADGNVHLTPNGGASGAGNSLGGFVLQVSYPAFDALS